jgi:hypothetical protein
MVPKEIGILFCFYDGEFRRSIVAKKTYHIGYPGYSTLLAPRLQLLSEIPEDGYLENQLY